MALPAFLGLAGWARARQDGDEEVSTFLADWAARTAELVGRDEPNEDEHLHALCAGLARRVPGSFPRRTKETYAQDGLTIGPLFGEPSFFVLDIDLEPGAVIRPHNHVGYAFVTLGAAGEVTARHYELLAGAPDPAEKGVDFRLREVQSALLVPGRTSSLTRSRANIHAFQAGEQGARMIDFGVHFPDPGPGPRTFSMLAIDPDPVDRARRVHTARWIDTA